MLDISFCRDHFRKVLSFAKASGLRSQLRDTLRYLNSYANRPGCTYDKQLGRNTMCRLGKDFAPHSFGFAMFARDKPNGDWQHWFSGGLIYQGPTSPADGGAPSFTVSLAEGTGWFVHT